MKKLARAFGFLLMFGAVSAVAGHVYSHCIAGVPPITECEMCQCFAAFSATSVDLQLPAPRVESMSPGIVPSAASQVLRPLEESRAPPFRSL